MLALLVATADRRAGDARRAEHGRPEDRAARAAADGRDALVAAMDGAARAQLRLDPDHAAVESSTTTTATSRSRDGPDLRGGFDPELALSMLFRSQRRPSGGRTVTDFEAWVQPSVDAERYEVRTSSNYIAEVEPGVPLGLGYDGGNGTWNAAIAPRTASPVPATTNEATISIRRDTTGRRAGHRLRAALRHAHRRARRQRRAASARAGRAERGGDRDDRRARPGDHQPLVPLTRREGIATARGTAVQRRPRGAADRGRRLQLLGRRRAGRAHPHRQGAQARAC